MIKKIVKIIAFPILNLNERVKKTNWYKNVIPDKNNYPTNEWYREHEERNYDIINIGSSSAKYAFDYSSCNILAFNWADRPQSLSYSFRLIKQYFSILKDGGIVVVSLGPFSGLNVDGKWAKTANDKYFHILDPVLIDNYKGVSRRRRYPLVFNMRASFFALIKDCKPLIQKEYTDVSFNKDADMWMNMWMTEFNINDLNTPLSDENRKGQVCRIKLLSDMIDFCIERDLKPILVIPPMHPLLSKRFSETFRENYIYSFVNKANTIGVPFYNFMDDERFGKDEFFQNSFFMNKKGAQYFTGELLKEIGVL